MNKMTGLKLVLMNFILMLGIPLMSCQNSVHEMTESFNTKVTAGGGTNASEIALVPGNPGFNEKNMLQEKYLVGNDATLCLYAPQASYYFWQIYIVNTKHTSAGGYNFEEVTFDEVIVNEYIPIHSRALTLYIPDVSHIIVDGTYKIVLTVKDKDGHEYKDEAALVVYKPYHVSE